MRGADNTIGAVRRHLGPLAPCGCVRYKRDDGPLTARERSVVQLIAEGHSNKKIASILNLSVKTVETHRGAVQRKLNTHSTAGLYRYAIRNKKDRRVIADRRVALVDSCLAAPTPHVPTSDRAPATNPILCF